MTQQLELAGAGAALRTVEGLLVYVTYANEETGYSVLKVGLDGAPPGSIDTWVGIAPPLKPGARLRGRGRVEDSKYGPQLRCETIFPILPTGVEGIELYLGSGVLPRVGPALARRIVAKFGDKTFETLTNDPQALLLVEGIGPTTLAGIIDGWATEQSTAELMAFLEQHGASPGLAGAIVKRYKSQAIHIVSTQPYRLALEVNRVGFKTADTIARSVGITADAPERAQAAALHTLHEMTTRGHCYATMTALADATADLLGPGAADTYEAIEMLAHHIPPPVGASANERPTPARVIIERLDNTNLGDPEDDMLVVYPRALYTAEVELADRIRDIMAQVGAELGGAAEAIAKFEKESGKTLAPEQRAAVEAVATHKIVVVTGGPGTGKSLVTKAILSVLEGAGLTVLLASPTGRAAKRLSEATGHPASTVHRTLGMREGGRGFMFTRENPLTTASIVIDEFSMAETALANSLFQALRTTARVVIVGDVDQLPSVGPGAVLRDIIESAAVPTIRLTRIFRQAEGSQIIEAAACINRGQRPIGAAPGTNGEFFIFPETDSAAASQKVVRFVASSIPTRFGFDPVRDIQVITPMIKGTCGVIELNRVLQATLNPTGPSITRGQTTYRLGDKVIQTKNDYDRDCFNGDIGVIVQVYPAENRLVVDMDGHEVAYEKGDLDHLMLAYAITCHKFQGSQAKAVVVVLMREHFMLLSRNHLYTSVTRAEKLCVLVADPSALATALKETRRELRRTRLAWRLQDGMAAA